MTRFQIVVIFIVLAFLCALWSPWNNWNISISQLFGVAPPSVIGGLQVSSLSGELELFVDGISQGKVTPEDSPLIVPDVEPGERQIKLVRSAEVENAYWEFNRLIKFESGVDVVVAYEIGPSSDFSEGHIIYATRNADETNETFLNVNVNPDAAQVYIDDQLIGTSPVVSYALKLDKQYKLKITHNGYDDQEFTILPQDQAERDKLRGFNVNVEAGLFLQPIELGL